MNDESRTSNITPDTTLISASERLEGTPGPVVAINYLLQAQLAVWPYERILKSVSTLSDLIWEEGYKPQTGIVERQRTVVDVWPALLHVPSSHDGSPFFRRKHDSSPIFVVEHFCQGPRAAGRLAAN